MSPVIDDGVGVPATPDRSAESTSRGDLAGESAVEQVCGRGRQLRIRVYIRQWQMPPYVTDIGVPGK